MGCWAPKRKCRTSASTCSSGPRPRKVLSEPLPPSFLPLEQTAVFSPGWPWLLPRCGHFSPLPKGCSGPARVVWTHSSTITLRGLSQLPIGWLHPSYRVRNSWAGTQVSTWKPALRGSQGFLVCDRRAPGRKPASLGFLTPARRTCLVACADGEHLPGEDGPPAALTSRRHRPPAEERPGKARFGIHRMASRKPFSCRRCSRNSDGSRHCHSNCTFLKLSRYGSRVEAMQKRGSLPVGKAHPADEAAEMSGTSARLGFTGPAWWGLGISPGVFTATQQHQLALRGP